MTIFPYQPYTQLHLNKKPSQHTLGKLKQLDTRLDEISQALNKGTHPVDTLALRQKAFEELNSIFTDEDRQILDTLDNNFDKYLSIQEKLRNNGYAASTGVETTVKRHMIEHSSCGHIADRVFPNWFKLAHAQQKEQYKAWNNRLYPIRSTKGLPIEVKRFINDIGISQSGERYSSGKVKPFLSTELTETERAALYDQLSCERITKVENPLEKGLLGEYGVKAARFIPKGTCIGVYGGTVFQNVPENLLQHIGTYLLAPSDGKLNGPLIDGDNVLARMNTTFLYKSGKPYQQAPFSAYNVERVDFKVELMNGMKIRIPSFFTTKDIQPGEELRFDYGYTEEMIKANFNS